jgi:hypothetical protein
MKNNDVVVSQLAARIAEAPARTARRQRIGSPEATDPGFMCPVIPCIIFEVHQTGPPASGSSVRSRRRRA